MGVRAYGQGSVFQRSSDGRWIAKFRPPEGKPVTFSAKTREDAERRLDAWLAEHHPTVLTTFPIRPRRARADHVIAARALASHTVEEWAEVVRAAQGKCYYCRRLLGRSPHKDHKLPVSRGGSDGVDNLALACWDCNMEKGNMTEEEFLAHAERVGFFAKPRKWAVRPKLPWDSPLRIGLPLDSPLRRL